MTAREQLKKELIKLFSTKRPTPETQDFWDWCVKLAKLKFGLIHQFPTPR